MGAERQYDREVLVPEICERLAAGETLSAICRDLSIPRRTVNQWRLDDDVIAEQFRVARAEFIETHADACLEISDQASTDRGQIERDKLRIWTRMQLIARSQGGSPAHKDKGEKPQTDTIVIFGGARDE